MLRLVIKKSILIKNVIVALALSVKLIWLGFYGLNVFLTFCVFNLQVGDTD